jgi:hypothetical protein
MSNETPYNYQKTPVKIVHSTGDVSNTNPFPVDVIKAAGLTEFGKDYDFVGVTYPTSTQEVYTFRTGGSNGTIVGTLTVNYTNSSKDFILDATKVVV